MTTETATPLKAHEGGRNFTVKDHVISDEEAANCAATPDPLQEAGQLGKDGYALKNAATLAEVTQRLESVGRELAERRGVLAVVEKKVLATAADQTPNLPVKPDATYRPGMAEKAGAFLLGLLRFVLIGVTVCVVAVYIRASGYSIDLSESWPLAMGFAFPIIVASMVLSSMIDRYDEDAARRFAKRTGLLGAVTLAIWAACTAALFGLEGQTLAPPPFGGAATANMTPVPLVEIQRWIKAMFPQTVVGGILLLTHITADVLLSASAGAYVKIIGKIGRETVWDRSNRSKAFQATYDAMWTNLRSLNAEHSYLAGIIAAYAAGEQAADRNARAKVAAILQMIETEERVALSETISRSRGIYPRAAE